MNATHYCGGVKWRDSTGHVVDRFSGTPACTIGGDHRWKRCRMTTDPDCVTCELCLKIMVKAVEPTK